MSKKNGVASQGLLLNGGALKAALLVAENPLLRGMMRARFFEQLQIDKVMEVEMKGDDAGVRPALLPWLPAGPAQGGGR